MKMFKRNISKKGTSTSEWMILTTAVVSVFLVFLSPEGGLSRKLSDVLTTTADGMQEMGSRLGTSVGSGCVGGVCKPEEAEGQSAPAVPTPPTSPEVGEEGT